MTIYYLKDLISGDRRCRFLSSISILIYINSVVIKSDQVRHLHVPQYDTLTIALLYAEMVKIPEVLTYLPVPKEVKKLPKQFLVNLAYSIVGDDFAAWVKQRI